MEFRRALTNYIESFFFSSLVVIYCVVSRCVCVRAVETICQR